MYKRVILILIAVFLVTGASCSLPGRNNNDSDRDNPFQGKEGIAVSFWEGAPPDNVYRGAPFDITVDIHNKGALDVDVVNLRIDGLSRAIYTGVVDDRLRAVDGGLRGKDSSYLGEIKDVTWNTIGIENNLPIRKDMRQEVNIEYCYSGSVEAFPEVCVKPL